MDNSTCTVYVTAEQLKAIAGLGTPCGTRGGTPQGTLPTLLIELADSMNEFFPKAGIDTLQEIAHFLAQACHETDRFRTLTEYASGKAYEGRLDLGNTEVGDGEKYKGRGIFQITGRENYVKLGKAYNDPGMFVQDPTLLAKPSFAVWSACSFWDRLRLNDIANQDDHTVLKMRRKGVLLELTPIEYISYRINGGANGLAQRKSFYQYARVVLLKAALEAQEAQTTSAAPATAPEAITKEYA